MTLSKLRNKLLKSKSQECKKAYNKQRSLCVAMVRKAEINYFNNLNVRNITDNKQFWKNVKPFFSNTRGQRSFKKEAETFESYPETFLENIGINANFHLMIM